MPSYVEVTIQNLQKRESSGKTTNFENEEFTELVDRIVRDGGTGTWLPLAGLEKRLKVKTADIDSRSGVRPSQADAKQGSVHLQFPYENFDFSLGGIPHLLGTVAGDILGYPEIADARIADVRLPPEALDAFRGPQTGIEGVRKVVGVKDRPLIAFTAKPRIGLDPERFAIWCADAAEGGADIVEDDERLLNPRYCGMIPRAEAVLKEFSRRKLKDKIYSVNITANEEKACEFATKLVKMGIRMLKFDVLAGGFGALQHLTRELADRQVPVTVYPGMGFVFRAIDRNVILMLTRLAGGDIVYAGTPSLGGELGRHDVNWGLVHESVQRTKASWNVLKDELGNIRDALPTVSTSIHPGNIGLLYYIANEKLPGPKDFAYFIGGGIAFHPMGPKAGARMCLRALELAMHSRYKITDFPKDDQRMFETSYLGRFFPVDDYKKMVKA